MECSYVENSLVWEFKEIFGIRNQESFIRGNLQYMQFTKGYIQYRVIWSYIHLCGLEISIKASRRYHGNHQEKSTSNDEAPCKHSISCIYKNICTSLWLRGSFVPHMWWYSKCGNTSWVLTSNQSFHICATLSCISYDIALKTLIYLSGPPTSKSQVEI